MKMEIHQCLKILELDEEATLDEAKESYKDLVNIWHPDRFSNNTRLKQKAEDKLKEINIAYEIVVSFLSSNKSAVRQSTQEPNPGDVATSKIKTNPSREAEFHRPEAETLPKNKTQAFVETGTKIILGLFSSLYANFRRIVADVKAEIDQGTLAPRPKNDKNREDCGRGNASRRPGRGRGMGKRGGGRGRGRN